MSLHCDEYEEGSSSGEDMISRMDAAEGELYFYCCEFSAGRITRHSKLLQY